MSTIPLLPIIAVIMGASELCTARAGMGLEAARRGLRLAGLRVGP